MVSALGFGAMRLPTRGKEADVDEAAAVEMIRYAIDHGVDYVDTAYVYHGGNGEAAVGKALADGFRKRVRLATKLPIWSVETRADCDRFLDEQLARLRTDQIDFYLLHCLNRNSWAKMRDLGVARWAEEARADGRIRHFGFSFHDTYEAFVEIVDDYDWSFCQIQHNICNEEVQAGTKGLRYAAAKGLGVIVMEPLFGGTLANPPPSVQPIWDSGGGSCRPADVALRWLWNKPEVSLVLSGMTTMEQVQQNIGSACRSGVGCFTEEEAELVARVQQEYQRLSPIPCTRCGYCMPCPNGVSIPVNFELFNNATVFKGSSVTLCRNLYQFLPEAERAGACLGCAICEEKCPQGIPISKMMERVREQFK
jgi:predicted aldo/keto reductase-like oxidoreductase